VPRKYKGGLPPERERQVSNNQELSSHPVSASGVQSSGVRGLLVSANGKMPMPIFKATCQNGCRTEQGLKKSSHWRVLVPFVLFALILLFACRLSIYLLCQIDGPLLRFDVGLADVLANDSKTLSS